MYPPKDVSFSVSTLMINKLSTTAIVWLVVLKVIPLDAITIGGFIYFTLMSLFGSVIAANSKNK